MNYLIKNKVLLLFIGIVFFYALIVLYSDVSKVGTHLGLINPVYFLIVFPLFISSLLLRGLRYQLLLREIGIKINYLSSFQILLAGMSMLITPGGIGTIIKSHILKQKTGKSYSSTAPLVIYEKWLEIFSNVLVISILLFWTNFLESKIVLGVSIIIIILIYIFLRKPTALKYLNVVTAKISFLQKYILNYDKFQESAIRLLTIKNILKNISITLASKILVLFSIYFVFQSFDIDFGIFFTSQIYLTSVLMGILAMIPGGLFVTEAGLLGLLVGNGIEFSEASAVVLVIRFVTLWFSVLLGFTILKLLINKKFE